MSVGAIELTLWVVDEGADAQELDDATSDLRQELLCLEVRRVEPARAGQAPAGSKGPGADLVGALAVTVSQLDGLKAVVAAVRTWIGDRRQRWVRIELDGDRLEVSGLTDSQQQQLIDGWLRRHTGL